MTIDPTTHDHAADKIVQSVFINLADSFHDHDSDDCPFGPFANVETAGNVLTVSPDRDASNYQGEDVAGRLVDGEAPATPVVRITVERIA